MTEPVLLRPGLRALPRADDEVQLGTDPRWAVRLVGLTPAEARLWADVDDTTDLGALAAGAHRAGVDPASVAATVAELQRAGLTQVRRASPARGPTAADATAWSLLRPDAGGDDVLDARSRAVVGVVGLGPTGMCVARQLATSGVGALLLDDDTLVRSSDVAAGAHRWADVGTPRAVAARHQLREVAPGTQVEGEAAPDVVVVVEPDAADPLRAVRLVGEQVTHLSVVVRTADATVGPLVRPGTDPCLRCLDLHRADADPAWPTVLGALTGRRRHPPGEVGVLAGAAGALAAAAVLTLLAGATPALCGASVELALPHLVGAERRWSVHPRCGCTGVPDAGPRG